MSIFQLTIGKILFLIETITNYFIGKGFYLFKSSIFLLSLLFSIFLIFLWFRYELKNKDEIKKWQLYLKTVKDYLFLKNPKKNFEEIKKIFYQDKILALQEINKFLDFVLTNFGYSGTLEEKIEKVNEIVLPNKEDLKKALTIYKLIEEKIKNNEKVELSDDEYLLVFHQYELALFNLNIINQEDFLAKNLK